MPGPSSFDSLGGDVLQLELQRVKKRQSRSAWGLIPSRIRVELKITIVMADGSVRPVFDASHDGITNARGQFSYGLKIDSKLRKAGEAVATITAITDGTSNTVTRMYVFRVFG